MRARVRVLVAVRTKIGSARLAVGLRVGMGVGVIHAAVLGERELIIVAMVPVA